MLHMQEAIQVHLNKSECHGKVNLLHKEGKPQTFKKLAVHRVLYPSMLTES